MHTCTTHACTVSTGASPHRLLAATAAAGFHDSVAAWAAQVRSAVDDLERHEALDHMRRSTAHSMRYGYELPPPGLPAVRPCRLLLRSRPPRGSAPRPVITL